MLGCRADGLRSLRERWMVGRRMDGARADSPWQGRGYVVGEVIFSRSHFEAEPERYVLYTACTSIYGGR